MHRFGEASSLSPRPTLCVLAARSNPPAVALCGMSYVRLSPYVSHSVLLRAVCLPKAYQRDEWVIFTGPNTQELEPGLPGIVRGYAEDGRIRVQFKTAGTWLIRTCELRSPAFQPGESVVYVATNGKLEPGTKGKVVGYGRCGRITVRFDTHVTGDISPASLDRPASKKPLNRTNVSKAAMRDVFAGVTGGISVGQIFGGPGGAIPGMLIGGSVAMVPHVKEFIRALGSLSQYAISTIYQKDRRIKDHINIKIEELKRQVDLLNASETGSISSTEAGEIKKAWSSLCNNWYFSRGQGQKMEDIKSKLLKFRCLRNIGLSAIQVRSRIDSFRVAPRYIKR